MSLPDICNSFSMSLPTIKHPKIKWNCCIKRVHIINYHGGTLFPAQTVLRLINGILVLLILSSVCNGQFPSCNSIAFLWSNTNNILVNDATTGELVKSFDTDSLNTASNEIIDSSRKNKKSQPATEKRSIDSAGIDITNESEYYRKEPSLISPGIVFDSWFYYFSSLAQTIAAGSALLMALALIRLQTISNSLLSIERSIAEVFYHAEIQHIYQNSASIYYYRNHWKEYLKKVRELADEYQYSFPDKGKYNHSLSFLQSLIAQGADLESKNQKLNRALAFAFGSTLLFAGAAILIIPFARWVTPSGLYVFWIVSGIFLVILFYMYFRLIKNSFKTR